MDVSIKMLHVARELLHVSVRRDVIAAIGAGFFGDTPEAINLHFNHI